MSTIRISRPRQFGDIFRKYRLFVDGERVATIRGGQTLELSVEPGPHTIQGRIDWLKTDEMDFDTTVWEPAFVVRNGLTPIHFLLSPLAMLFSTTPWIVLEPVE